MLSVSSIDNIILYTRKLEVCEIISQVFNYNVIKNGRLYGFDDYDQLELNLKNLLIRNSEKEIEQKVLEYILQPYCHRKDEFALTVENFLS